MNDAEIFIHALQSASDLPSEVCADIDNVKLIRQTLIDQSQIDLLDTQIRLSSRGPKWTKRLKKRRAGLLPYCNKPLLKGRIEHGVDAYWIMVDPETKTVVYWELYEQWSEKLGG
jgi:hypothetical protein